MLINIYSFVLMFEGPGNPSAPRAVFAGKPAHTGNVKTPLAGCIFFDNFTRLRRHQGAALSSPPFSAAPPRPFRPKLLLPARLPGPEAQLLLPTVRPPDSG